MRPAPRPSPPSARNSSPALRARDAHPSLNPQANDPSLPGKKFWVPVFTGQDLCQAVRTQAPCSLPDGGDCGAAFTQLQPAVPQAPADVRAGETFFLLDVSGL
jgi:hypothetical protein